MSRRNQTRQTFSWLEMVLAPYVRLISAACGLRNDGAKVWSVDIDSVWPRCLECFSSEFVSFSLQECRSWNHAPWIYVLGPWSKSRYPWCERYIFMRGKLVLPPESTSVEASKLLQKCLLLKEEGRKPEPVHPTTTGEYRIEMPCRSWCWWINSLRRDVVKGRWGSL